MAVNLDKLLTSKSSCGNWGTYGAKKPKVLVAGHSHSFCMLLALKKRKDLRKTFAVISQLDMSRHTPVDESYWAFVNESSKDKTLAISWNGNQHNIHFLIDNDFEFRSIGFNEKKDLPAISLSRIYKLFEPTFHELELALKNFENKSQIIFLGTPPPKNKSFLNTILKDDQFFTELAEKQGIPKNTLTVSSDNLRVFMWEATQILLKNKAEQFGSKFVEVPSNSFDENKIMLEVYSSNDLTHANELFGELMLDEINNYLTSCNSE